LYTKKSKEKAEEKRQYGTLWNFRGTKGSVFVRIVSLTLTARSWLPGCTWCGQQITEKAPKVAASRSAAWLGRDRRLRTENNYLTSETNYRKSAQNYRIVFSNTVGRGSQNGNGK